MTEPKELPNVLPVNARGVYIKSEAAADPRSMARIERMLPFIHFGGDPVIVDDEGLCRLVAAETPTWGRHGLRANEVEPVVIFNQFLNDHQEAERQRRREAYPDLFRGGGPVRFGGYGGFDWRPSGDPAYRERTGQVCQPAYALHSFWGCHFRCVYCSLGHVAQVYVNLEDWVDHIERGCADLANAPGQNLFQWDNGSDIVCWEPEYGGTKLLVDVFARQPDKYLELYVGKSDHVDFMLDYDHRGHTLCCWSLCHEAQTREVEKRTASMEARLSAARTCQDAGYPVRIRLSPMVPTVGWEAEIRHMVQRMFEEIKPEILTIEPLRFYTYDQLCNDFAPGVIDPEFLTGIRDAETGSNHYERQFPEELVKRMYRVVFEEVLRISPQTPVAFCREKRTVWDAFRTELARSGQDPDDYVCNCGPVSAGADARLVAATA
ncbi:MAG: hypothetical protein HN742_25455 [Lentisphaerae bacterium]|nr:hypothetical protein [Lentisphaerota bacterium]MBT4820834.1 hypothetical protein [Lentisphaerota bacterium]MBT5612268.1 hypothetical protein [Lentisphaerota bacterium]MBT7060754.1 hypothetical protein [Lentisphaerota bacterium]MBT7845247.1 hypothetical protein [Lentisphaerota bacterium]